MRSVGRLRTVWARLTSAARTHCRARRRASRSTAASARSSARVSGNRAAYLGGVRQSDVDLRIDTTLDTAATGGGAYVSLIGRRVSNGNDYHLKLLYKAGGSVIAYLGRNVGGVETILSTTTVTGLTVNPGDLVRSRFMVSGTNPTTLRAKVWKATATEPTAWLATFTDASTPAALQAAGDMGTLLYVSGSWTGTVPTLSIDNFKADADFSPPPGATLPTATFTKSATFLAASFNGTGSTAVGATISSYSWNFGDGTTGTGATPNHTYAAGGTYPVTLTVTDSNGNTSLPFSSSITVSPVPAPTASFTSTPTYLAVAFDGTGSSTPSGRSRPTRGTSVTARPVPVRRRTTPMPRARRIRSR